MIAKLPPLGQAYLQDLLDEDPAPLFDSSFSVRVVEVAKKYDAPEGQAIQAIPEYTTPGGPNSYICTDVHTSWTQGFFPGMLWLLAERRKLLSSAVDEQYSGKELVERARHWQESFRHLARPSLDHDQGFRFQLSFGRDYRATGDAHARAVLLEAAESMMDRYDPKLGLFRSWDKLPRRFPAGEDTSRHYIVIMDSMMNLDMMYEATELTGDPRFACAATSHARACAESHVRPDHTTYHVVDFCPETGAVQSRFSAQGWQDESCWARGQAWGIYGFAQCALRTGKEEFADTSRRLADVFLSYLGPTGVPKWDFDVPDPAPYDASAATVAACGLCLLSRAIAADDPAVADYYLGAAFRLINDTLRECAAPAATLGRDGRVEWGEGGWETILKHSTIAGNANANRRLMDHGLIYADYYLLEFGNEVLKMRREMMKG